MASAGARRRPGGPRRTRGRRGRGRSRRAACRPRPPAGRRRPRPASCPPACDSSQAARPTIQKAPWGSSSPSASAARFTASPAPAISASWLRLQVDRGRRLRGLALLLGRRTAGSGASEASSASSRPARAARAPAPAFSSRSRARCAAAPCSSGRVHVAEGQRGALPGHQDDVDQAHHQDHQDEEPELEPVHVRRQSSPAGAAPRGGGRRPARPPTCGGPRVHPPARGAASSWGAGPRTSSDRAGRGGAPTIDGGAWDRAQPGPRSGFFLGVGPRRAPPAGRGRARPDD